ncbi:NAD-dependent aldehyde dehydrogenase [Synechococcus sp. PCC 7502]|uniref:aldehyde dehydrogenase n=1 Tax=Synechococcus sp. PCC 7502 TaxID=1173263 RepID=UPI00029F89D6|nr:aldehyde dehydrogenase [Synechococcus sp. PCC 7502]AFY72832.1 NAD-dependent aldehyde dehydrogenase [Synechococcus sp. PCC 7502]
MSIPEIVETQRQFFNTGVTKELKFRLEQLKLLAKITENNDRRTLDALKADLHKPAIEAYGSEILVTLGEIKYTLKHLKSWVKPQKVPTPLSQFIASSYIYTEPVGVVLIISPWNYPFQLAIAPLIGAIAAGNCTVIKPSEYAPHTSALLAELICENFDPRFLTVVQGEVETSQALLAEKFDHIFFTGGTEVGKIVMGAAAKQLTPVTLELGGKSPAIIDAECDLDLATKRMIWGKFYNAGQTCIAPDYVLVHESIKFAVIAKIRHYLQEFYGNQPQQSPDYARVINQRQFDRLIGLIKDIDQAQIIIGGHSDRQTLYIAPTVIDVHADQLDTNLMQEEIFGSILPILTYKNLNEAIAYVNAKPRPLALYFFSTNKQNQDRLIREISFGGGCINDTIMHLSTPELPFGGIGNSGIGSYHGKASFDTFSHRKSILKKSFLFDLKWRYPPYKISFELMKKLIN